MLNLGVAVICWPRISMVTSRKGRRVCTSFLKVFPDPIWCYDSQCRQRERLPSVAKSLRWDSRLVAVDIIIWIGLCVGIGDHVRGREVFYHACFWY